MLLIVAILLALFMKHFHRSQKKRIMRIRQKRDVKEPLVQNHNSLNVRNYDNYLNISFYQSYSHISKQIQYQSPPKKSTAVQTDMSSDLMQQSSPYAESHDSMK